MSEREVTVRTVVVTYFPMFIATLSLITSIYNGYLNTNSSTSFSATSLARNI
jgi:hypothetical protein